MPTILRTGKACACIILGLLAASQARAWQPAPETTGREVLIAAHRDTSEGRLAEAAEKYAWFHEHVLEREPSMYGVRLSFALSDWAALAQRYAPAMAQLTAERDRAVERVADGGTAAQQALTEVIAFNRYLQAPESTREAYTRLVARDPVIAERATSQVLPALIELNDIALAARHLRVDDELARTERLYTDLKSAKTGLPADQLADVMRWQQRHVDLQLARIAYVLCKDGRPADAARVVARGRALLEPDASTHHMTEALRCIAPPGEDRG